MKGAGGRGKEVEVSAHVMIIMLICESEKTSQLNCIAHLSLHRACVEYKRMLDI